MPRVRTSIALLFSAVSLGSGALLGQAQSLTQETLEVPIGSIFEIQAVGDAGAAANWVLTRQGEFVEAGRDMVFRTRFSQEGNYALAAQVTENKATIERLFLIEIRQRRDEEIVPPATPDAVVAFDPPADGDVIPVTPSRQIVTVRPVRDDISVLAIDFDTTSDSNGDGNPQNDEDTRNTLFRSEGNPLHVWFVGGRERSIRLGALSENGATTFATLGIGKRMAPIVPEPQSPGEEEPAPIEQGMPMQIMVLRSDNGEVQFALRVPAEVRTPLLLLWDFGDGTQSMLDRPVHTYAESGNYSVTVDVRDLQTGEVVGSARDDVAVNRMLVEPAQGGETTEEEPKESGGSLLGTVLKLLFGLVLSGAFGAVIVFIIGKVKRSGFSLEKSLEKAEKTVMKTPQETVSTEPPPLEIAAEEISEAEPAPPVESPSASAEWEKPSTPAPSTPASSKEKQEDSLTPSWLTEGLQQAEASTPVAPVAEAEAPPPLEKSAEPPAPNVSHSAMTPSAEELTVETQNAPDWLQAGMQKADQAGQSPATPPPSALQAEQAPTPPTTPPQTVTTNADAGSPELDEPVAFIKAEDIPPMENSASASPPPAPGNAGHTEEGGKAA